MLYHNNGNGTFTDATHESGLLQPEDHWNTGAAFVDYNRDGHLDLFVSNYVEYEYGLKFYESNPESGGREVSRALRRRGTQRYQKLPLS